MEVTQFYLHLPSNSSLDKYPNNTLTEYRVGLPPGHYSSIEDILLKMKELVDNEKRYGDNVKFTYDKLSRKVTVHLQNNTELFFDDIGYLLGFPPKQIFSTTTTAEREADLEYGFHDLYIYCDITQPQYVGNALVPLLRIVPVEGKDGQRISKSFIRPQYIPVSRKQFESIEVNIKRDTGDSVSFEFGRVLLTLHFRQIKPAKQKGGSLPAFHGARFQRGYGLGSIFKGLFRWAVPHLQQGAKMLGKKALQTGLNVAQDVLAVDNLNKAVAKQAKKVLAQPSQNAPQSGAGRKGTKRKPPTRNNSSPPGKKQKTSPQKKKPKEKFPFLNGPIEFNVSGSGEEYLDLAKTQLFVKAKITKANGTALDPNTKVGPVNLFLHSLFSQVDVALNERLISPSTNTYPYRAMIETLLNYGEDAKSSQLSMAMFYKDTPGKMDEADPVAEDADANLGLKARYAFTKEISSAAGANFKVVITEAILYVRKVKVASSITLGHAVALKQTTAKYPIRRVDCKVLTIPTGFSSFTPDNLFLGRIPRRLVLVLVDAEAFNDHCSGDHFELTKQGNLRTELHFGEALANTVNLIIYAEFQSVIEIDASRNVLYDYTN
ncbi:hypothetical protein ACROYT_G019701 [Oculina patagonica]